MSEVPLCVYGFWRYGFTAVRRHGAAISVVCEGGAVCILSAPFLAA